MDEKIIRKAIESTRPEIRTQLEQLMNESPHLADATMEEVFLMYWTVGWLSSVLNGFIPFDRQRVRQVLNLDAVEQTFKSMV